MQTIIDGHVDLVFAVGIDQIKSVVLVQPPIKSKTLKPDTQLSGVLRPQLSRPYLLYRSTRSTSELHFVPSYMLAPYIPAITNTPSP